LLHLVGLTFIYKPRNIKIQRGKMQKQQQQSL